MSTVNKEIAAVKAKISDVEKWIAAAEMGGRSEAYIISLRSELVELRKVEIEHMKVEVDKVYPYTSIHILISLHFVVLISPYSQL